MMAELNELAPNYHRAHRKWPDAPSLGNHYEALAACFAGSGYGLVEHVKSFIESVCVTIMGEFGESMPSSTPSTTDLLVAALGPLGLRNTRGGSKCDKVLSSFNRLTDALTEMRNEMGPIAHGKDGFLDSLTSDHVRIFLSVGDAILGILLNALEGKEPDLNVTREPYESFPHLNERIDRAVSVKVLMDENSSQPVVVFSVATGLRGEEIKLRVEPSRLLYGIDRGAYIEVLNAADFVVTEEEEEGEEPEAEAEVMKTPEVAWATAQTGQRTALVPTYSGSLNPFLHGLEAFLAAEAIEPTETDTTGNRLIDSLLATVEQNMSLDWIDRDVIRARLKVVSKRTLVHFGVNVDKAEEIAGRLVAWLRVQVGKSDTAAPPVKPEVLESGL